MVSMMLMQMFSLGARSLECWLGLFGNWTDLVAFESRMAHFVLHEIYVFVIE